MNDDAELLRRFVESRSEPDFAELVRRNAALVFHAALRRTGGRADLAEEVSQQVFAALAHSAPKLVRHTSLAGWLYTTTRLTAYHKLRDEERRRRREQQFAAMTELTKPEAQIAWEKLRPELDGLLDALSDSDREAVLMRYLQGRSLAEVGLAIGLAPDSARKRIERAVDHLRRLLAQRGLTTSAVVVAELLANEANGAVPPQLIQQFTAAALKQFVPAGSAASSAAAVATVGLSGAAALGIAIVVLGGAAGAVGWSVHAAHAARAELRAAQSAVRSSEARLRSERAAASRPAVSPVDAASVPANGAATAVIASKVADGPNAPADAAATARENGARFLATVPEARARLTAFEKTQMHATFAGFYRAAQMTPAEIDAFEERVAAYHLSHVELSGNRMVTTAGDLPAEQVDALLGPERGALYRKYMPEMPARMLALEAAATVNYVGSIANPTQLDQLTHVLSEANPAYQAGGKVDLAQEDWNQALPRLQALFTPAQWKATEGLFLRYAYEQALHEAQAASVSTPVAAADGGTP